MGSCAQRVFGDFFQIPPTRHRPPICHLGGTSIPPGVALQKGVKPEGDNFWYLFVIPTQFPGYRLTGIPTHRYTDSVKILGLLFGVGLGFKRARSARKSFFRSIWL